MRRVALALILLRRASPAAASAQIVPPHNSQPEADRQGRHDPGGARRALSRNDAADGRRHGRHARHLPDPRDASRSRPRAISSCSIPSGSPAATARAATSRTSPASAPAPTASRSSGCATRSTSTPSTSPFRQECQRGRRRLPVCLADRRQPGPDRRDARTWRASSGCRNSLYPAGYYVRQIPVQASVIVPAGWKVATALRPSAPDRQPHRLSGDQLRDPDRFAADRRRALPPDPAQPDVALDVIADTPAELAATPEQIAAHKRLVEQAVKAFGAQHYDHYDFLLTISDNLGGNGLEHHRSSEDGVEPRLFHRLGKQAARPQPAAARIYATAGTASSAAPPTCGRPTIARRCRTACCGSTKARRNSGAMSSARARGCCRSRTRSTRSPRPPRPTAPARRAAPGGRWSTRPTIRSSPAGRRSRGAAGSAARIITAKAS